MTTRLGPLATACAGALLLLTATSCGSSGSDAVASSRSLDELGATLAKDGGAVQQYLAGTLGGTSGGADQAVSDDGSKDVRCSGGSRRTYHGSVSGPVTAAGGDRGSHEVTNTLGLAAQIAFKRVRYDLAGKVDKTSKDLPATLDFSNDPSSKDQARRFSTTVRITGDTVTTTISGETACIKN